MSGELERVWRAERLGVVATLSRRLGDLQLAEDCAQDAFVAAAERWPVDGVPERPGAWLTVVAWRRALDVLRRERPTVALDDLQLAEQDDTDARTAGVDDDRLGLILACCHPALALDVRVALTLRHVVGLSAAEIAAALLVAEPALSKRLVRARRKLQAGAVSFAAPGADELTPRLDAARRVVALLFTEGHHASGGGPAIRRELCDEAVHLARELQRLAPTEESAGLLALLLLQHARADARQGPGGRLVLLEEQDRERWDHAAIDEARALLATTGGAAPGPFQLQAAIALVLSADGPVPWRHVAALHRVLLRQDPSPIVALHHALAVGRGHGAVHGLELLDALTAEPALAGSPLPHAARADLLERAGDHEGAARAWSAAVGSCGNPEQREALLRRSRRAVLSAPGAASEG